MRRLSDVVQDCNINFLLGSGLSCPYLETLGNIELLLTELDKRSLAAPQDRLIRASIYKKYFDLVISKNVDIAAGDPAAGTVLKNYDDFLRFLNSALLQRKSTILSKQINLFTTNIDIFLDKSLERLGLEYNDGFNGRFSPLFSLSNFKKSRFITSLHYENTSEIPVFNLLKIHGSVCWQLSSTDQLAFSSILQHVRDIQKIAGFTGALAVDPGSTMDDLITACGKKSADGYLDQSSHFKPLTLENSFVFAVISVMSWCMAWPASSRS